MVQPTYYTVIIGKRACLVTYAQGPEYSVKLLPGPFANPDLAHEQVKRVFQCERTYLSVSAFDSRVRRLSEQYNRDFALLAEWPQGKPATPTHKKGKTPMPLTNEQYVNGLPVNALEQTEESLQQDLETLQENGFPVSDTVDALLKVHARLEEEQEETL